MMFLGGPLDGSDIEVEPVEGVWYYYAPGSGQAHRYVLSERPIPDRLKMEPVMVYRGAEER
jgi:hypothetical protein